MDGSIPKDLEFCFWDTNPSTLDLEKNADHIISRLYVKGGFHGINWVHETYSDEQIIHAAKTRRALNPIVANYLMKKYDLRKEDMAYYRMEKMGGRKDWPY